MKTEGQLKQKKTNMYNKEHIENFWSLNGKYNSLKSPKSGYKGICGFISPRRYFSKEARKKSRESCSLRALGKFSKNWSNKNSKSLSRKLENSIVDFKTNISLLKVNRSLSPSNIINVQRLKNYDGKIKFIC